MPPARALPDLDAVRLATPDDLARIATVAAAGFFHSPTFQYQRVHYAAYPDDTLLIGQVGLPELLIQVHGDAINRFLFQLGFWSSVLLMSNPRGYSSYWIEYNEAIQDPTSAVLVAEDVVNEHEGNSVYPALNQATAYSPAPGPVGSKIVVGVASVAIKPGSSYTGLFQTIGESMHQLGPLVASASPDRDFCNERVRVYNEATAPAKARHLKGLMRLSTLAVHPAYWRRGHATRLVSWSTRLADLDGVPMGISAVPQGAKIAATAGFEEREVVQVKRACMHSETSPVEGSHVAGVELWVAVRRPSGTPVSGDSATSFDSQEVGDDGADW